MKKIIFDYIPVKLDRAALMQANHIKPDTDLAEEFIGVLEASETVLRCKAVIKEVVLDALTESEAVLDGTVFSSSYVASSLRGKSRVFLYVMTVGNEIYACEDADYPVLGDIVKQAALDEAMRYTLAYISQNYGGGNISFINPGTLDDWPVELNKVIFNMIGEVTELTGAVMSQSGFMKPWYSSAGLIIL
jgi:hypothetical protein